MTSKRVFAGLLAPLLLACTSPPQSTADGNAEPAFDPVLAAFDPVLAEMGAPLYASRCAACHGERAAGDGPVAASLLVPPADLTRIAARRGGEFPAGEIARYIDGRFDTPAHGTREMPVWGERFGETIPEAIASDEIVRGKIATLIEYLKSVQRSD